MSELSTASPAEARVRPTGTASLRRELNAFTIIAHRDLLKLFRDMPRLVSSLIFPLIFIGILGGTFEANLGANLGYSFLSFTFTGVLAQTLFQSSAIGIVSLIEDRENDFSQEIFVSPVSRHSIVFGKILGEALVSMVQGVGIIIFAFVIGIPLSLTQVPLLLLVSFVVCIFGGAFGVVMMANLNSQRTANQIFPFVMLPQYFLAGVFAPIKVLPWYLDILSRISPMRYAVDLMRNAFYAGHADYSKVVLTSPITNLTVIGALFVVFLVIGTWIFVRKEQNR